MNGCHRRIGPLQLECLAGGHLPPPPTTLNELARVVHLTPIGRMHRRVGARSCPFKFLIHLELTCTRMNSNLVLMIVMGTLEILT